MMKQSTPQPNPAVKPRDSIVAFGVRTIRGGDGIEYIPVIVTVSGDEATIETIDVKRPYIQHAYAKAGDALIEYGITQAGKVRR